MRKKPVIMGVKLLTNTEIRNLMAAARFRRKQWERKGEWIYDASDCKLCGKYGYDGKFGYETETPCGERECPAATVKVVNTAIVDEDTQECTKGFSCVAVCGEYYLRDEELIPELVDTLIERCEVELLERKSEKIGNAFIKMSDSEKRTLLMNDGKDGK